MFIAAVRELAKNWRPRLSILFIVLAAWTLIDEYIKEGYVFDPRDILVPWVTHEKVFIVLLVVGLVMGLRRWRRSG